MNKFDKLFNEINECLLIEENSLEFLHRKTFTF